MLKIHQSKQSKIKNTSFFHWWILHLYMNEMPALFQKFPAYLEPYTIASVCQSNEAQTVLGADTSFIAGILKMAILQLQD